MWWVPKFRIEQLNLFEIHFFSPLNQLSKKEWRMEPLNEKKRMVEENTSDEDSVEEAIRSISAMNLW